MTKRLVVGGLIAIALSTTLLLGIALGQSAEEDKGGLLARLQPLLVTIKQSVPLSLTLSVPTSPTEVLTVTVPAVVDLNLQIRISDTVTDVQVIAPQEPAAVTVAVPTPTPVAAQRNRVLVWAIGDGGFDKMQSIAFGNHIDLTVRGPGMTLEEELQKTDLAAVIYNVFQPDDLADLADFRQRGGRVLFIYTTGWDAYNAQWQELFGVRIVNETVLILEGAVVDGEKGYLYEEADLVPWLSGLHAGFNQALKPLVVPVYLVSPAEGSESRSIVSATSGKERLVYYSNADKSVSFLPGLTRAPDGRQACCFFSGYSIDLFDNEDATLTMLKYVLGR